MKPKSRNARRRSPQATKVSKRLTHPELTRMFNDFVPKARKQGIQRLHHQRRGRADDPEAGEGASRTVTRG